MRAKLGKVWRWWWEEHGGPERGQSAWRDLQGADGWLSVSRGQASTRHQGGSAQLWDSAGRWGRSGPSVCSQVHSFFSRNAYWWPPGARPELDANTWLCPQGLGVGDTQGQTCVEMKLALGRGRGEALLGRSRMGQGRGGLSGQETWEEAWGGGLASGVQ